MLDLIGKLHPLLVHLPIGILVLAILLKLCSTRSKWEYLSKSLPIILLFGFMFSIGTCITGYILSLSGEYGMELVNKHQWAGIALTIITGLGYWVIERKFHSSLETTLWLSIGVLVTLTGHWGGSLTHGEDFLFSSNNTAPQSTITNVEEAEIYSAIINPILESKCYTCHSSKKQKGKLRLDQPEWIEKGGKNGPIIQVNQSEESELYRRLVLEELDEYHMPPKRKPQPTELEIKLIKWWIDSGASFEKRVNQIEGYEAQLPLLKKLEQAEERAISLRIPEQPIAAAASEWIQPWREVGAVVLPVAQNSNYLSVNFLEKDVLSKLDTSTLANLSDHIVWLKAGNSPVNTDWMPWIGKMENLRILHLNGTPISDEDLKYLSGLSHLQILNLTNTSISDKGLTDLGPMPKLESLYLFGSPVKEVDLENLKAQYPNTAIDIGGYFAQFEVHEWSEAEEE